MLSLNADAGAAGAQMTPGQARAVDPVLTTAARGYRHPEHVGMYLFPRVPTTLRGGRRIEFDRTDFRKVNSRRAPGASTASVQFGHIGKKFSLDQHRLMGKLPVENQEEAMREPGIDLGMRTVNGTQMLISLSREIAAAEVATASASYATGHVTTLAGGSQWGSAGSNPTLDISTGIRTVRKKIGMRPKTVLLGGDVLDVVQHHPKVLELLRYQAKDMATLEDLARLWNVSKVVAGDAIWVDEDDDAHDVWGKVAIVAYTAIGPVTRYEPSFGLGYTLAGTPMVEQPYYDDDKRSWMYPVCEEYAEEVVGADAGYLIKGVIA